MASLTMSPEDRAAVEAFRTNVLEASLTNVVLVRFTAEWCGPCKQLAPVMDKVIAETGEGRVRQVVIDVDQQGMIAAQFRIQSVPTVYAFIGGQPVDGFQGAKSERELKAFVEKLVTMLPPTEAEVSQDELLEAANGLLETGDAQQALVIFADLIQMAPEREDVQAGYARTLLALGEVDAAAEILANVPADSKLQAVIQARAALELAQTASGNSDEIRQLQARVEADPNDHQGRIDLAVALFAAGQIDAAADQLLASIAADRAWNEEAARAQLLKFIDARGFGDPWSIAVRRKLSQILFA